MLDRLPTVVEGIAGIILSYAVVLAAIATITMALLELFKVVFSARRRFHERRLAEWVRSPAAMDELLELTVADRGSAQALYDQPTDRMMAQIQAAAGVALDFPQRFPALFGFIASTSRAPASAADGGGTIEPSDAETWREFSARDVDATDVTPELRKATQARARLENLAQRKLDAFQTRTEYMWARNNQYVAVFAAGVFIFFALYNGLGDLLQVAVLSAVGGMVAPVSKDVVTALTNLRARV